MEKLNSTTLQSPALASMLSNKNTQKQPTVGQNTAPINEAKKINKKKLAFTAAAAIGLTTLAAGLVFYNIKGKGNNIIKTFTDEAGKAIKKVKLKNGKAILKDGSAFSGILETANKKTGDKFRIEYKDGFMVQSMKNGKLLKKFDNLENLSRSRGTKITEFNPDGSFKNLIENVYYDNGKIKKTADLKVQKSFHENGRLHSIEHREGVVSDSKLKLGRDFLDFEVYDKQGNLIKSYKKGIYTEIMPDSFKKEFITPYGTKQLNELQNTTDDIDNIKFSTFKDAKISNPKTGEEKLYHRNSVDKAYSIYDFNDDSYRMMFLPKGDSKFETELEIQIDEKNGYFTTITKNGIEISKEIDKTQQGEKHTFSSKTITGEEKEHQQARIIEKFKKELEYAKENNIWTAGCSDLYSTIEDLLASIKS